MKSQTSMAKVKINRKCRKNIITHKIATLNNTSMNSTESLKMVVSVIGSMQSI